MQVENNISSDIKDDLIEEKEEVSIEPEDLVFDMDIVDKLLSLKRVERREEWKDLWKLDRNNIVGDTKVEKKRNWRLLWDLISRKIREDSYDS